MERSLPAEIGLVALSPLQSCFSVGLSLCTVGALGGPASPQPLGLLERPPASKSLRICQQVMHLGLPLPAFIAQVQWPEALKQEINSGHSGHCEPTGILGNLRPGNRLCHSLRKTGRPRGRWVEPAGKVRAEVPLSMSPAPGPSEGNSKGNCISTKGMLLKTARATGVSWLMN